MKQTRAFLGLTGYYRKFVAQYAQVATPLTNLLRKEDFKWSDKARKAFNQLQVALSTNPVLAFPNFEIPFVVETDACDVGIKAVLLQLEHPISYSSKKMSLLRQRASTYSKELWALTESVQKWRHYLLGNEFTIRTDHCSLKNLLAQSIQSPEQQYFLTRLLGFTFKIVYKKGKDNIVADALSSLPTTEAGEEIGQLSKLTSSIMTDWGKRILEANNTDPWIIAKKEKLGKDEGDPDYSVKGDILFYLSKFCLGPTSDLKSKVLDELHGSKTGGHSGYYRTLRRVRQSFF